MRHDPTAYDLSQDLLIEAGYSVSPDPDQPGRYVWTRQEQGRTTGGCDVSLDSADAAWAEVAEVVAEILADEEGLSPDDWNGLPAEARFEAIVRLFR